ncbi:MAG: HD-GYP domain-containing protein [Pirellulales bacterium]|nr:HD-GYP domain-containing protein [Pirellulales bacterium]
MTATLSESSLLTTPCSSTVFDTAVWLAKSLPEPIFLWYGGAPWSCRGCWQRQSHCSSCTQISVEFCDRVEFWNHEELEVISRGLNEQLKSSLEPQSIPLSNGRFMVAFRLEGQKKNDVPIVLTTMADDDTAEILCQITELAFERNAINKRFVELEEDLDIYAAQMSDNFEELSFLRSIAEVLEAFDLTSNLVEMAKVVLPRLRTSIKAQEVVLFLAARDNDRRGTRMVRCEPTELSDSVCTRLLSVYHLQGPKVPVIRNNCNSSENIESFPGVNSFILTPITKSGSVMGWLLAINRSYRKGFEDTTYLADKSRHEFGSEEAGLISSAASMLASHAYNCDLFRQREELVVRVVRALVNAIEAKDPYTRGHSERVAMFARRLAVEIGLDDADCKRIYLSGLLHDVGKIGIKDATLLKPGKLTEEEFNEIKSHPDLGWDILSELTQLHSALPGVVHHHEQYNGSGYPDGLKGEEIPLDGRIMAIADAFDAMTSDRPYRPGMPNEKAIEILQNGAGEQWDAALVFAFVRIMPEIIRIRDNYETPQHPPRTEPVLQ